uniref:Uncharacterized protein n=1 Tax=Rhizophora mucronata TaxID=61149 RepID=A0A2P2Q8V1_RHIMU
MLSLIQTIRAQFCLDFLNESNIGFTAQNLCAIIHINTESTDQRMN